MHQCLRGCNIDQQHIYINLDKHDTKHDKCYYVYIHIDQYNIDNQHYLNLDKHKHNNPALGGDYLQQLLRLQQ